jgi:lipoyl(octanoyl) transferase
VSAAPVLVCDLGLVAYGEALAFQRAAAAARAAGTLGDDLLVLCEHPPVVTLGRATQPEHLRTSPAGLATRGIAWFEVERGGDVTVHEPGQLVGYPILDLRGHREDLHWYLRALETALIAAVGEVGIAAGRAPGRTGVWTARRKLASIGVHAKQWVTRHGFALNVVNDLATFAHVVPCGIPGVEMTTVAREVSASLRPHPVDDDGRQALAARVRDAVERAFGETFGRAPRAVARDVVAGAPLPVSDPAPA